MKPKIQITAMIFALVDEKLCLKVSRESQNGVRLPVIDFSNGCKEVESAIDGLLEEMNHTNCYKEQLYTFVEEDLIQISYLILLKPLDSLSFMAKDNWRWASINRVPKLHSLHQKVKKTGLQRLKNKVAYSRIAVRLLNDEFTLNDLQKVYEQILGEPLDKRNFRKKIENKKIAIPINKFKRGSHRPARLYKIGAKSKRVPL